MTRLTRAQVREIDRRAIGQYHIPGIVLMENAARAVVEAAWEMLPRRSGANVLILCGGGNNGGDGLAVARHLSNRGISALVVRTVEPSRYEGDALVNWNILCEMSVRLGRPMICSLDDAAEATANRRFDLVLDGIFGTGLSKPPRDPFRRCVDLVGQIGAPVLAIDLPSGLDCDTGEPLGACVRASRTVTFVSEKAGFANPASKTFTGEVIVGDIGCPPELVNDVLRG